jgi:transcriptional regulator of acetoin/glycerol metabolism
VITVPPPAVTAAGGKKMKLIPGLILERRPFAAYTESDSLDNFLDHAMLDLYELVRMKTGSHSQTARQLRIDRVSLYQRLERARRRLYLSTVNEAVASSF